MAKTEEYIPIPVERETVVNFNEGERTLWVYTHSPKWKKKLVEMFQEIPEQMYFHYPKNPTLEKLQELANSIGGYMDVELPNKKWVKLAGPSKRKEMTEEQKEAARQRLMAMHARHKAQAGAEEDIEDEPDDDDEDENDN